MKAYEKMGLTKDQVLEMQRWLYPQIANDSRSTESCGETIKQIVERYNGAMRQYAIYHFGHIVGGARVKEKLGIQVYLNPDDV